MDLFLKDKIILVTGGAKGIGEGISRILAEEKALPIIIGRNEQDNLKLVSQLNESGQKAFQLVVELTNPDECEKAINIILGKFGHIDGLVNNAGLNDGVNLENGNYELFMLSLHRNLVHYYLMAHYALPELKRSKGVILNITSKIAETGQGGSSAYAAANGLRNDFTKEWSVELLQYGIRVNSIVVAECWTPQYESWLQSFPHPKEKLKEITAKIPLGNRMTTSQEIGRTAAFLLSERASHVNGQLVHVDGGYVHLDRSLINS